MSAGFQQPSAHSGPVGSSGLALQHKAVSGQGVGLYAQFSESSGKEMLRINNSRPELGAGVTV